MVRVGVTEPLPRRRGACIDEEREGYVPTHLVKVAQSTAVSSRTYLITGCVVGSTTYSVLATYCGSLLRTGYVLSSG